MRQWKQQKEKLEVDNGEEMVVREDFESTLLIEDCVPKLSEDFKKCLVKMKKAEPAHQEDATYKPEIERNASIDEETVIANSVQLN